MAFQGIYYHLFCIDSLFWEESPNILGHSGPKEGSSSQEDNSTGQFHLRYF